LVLAWFSKNENHAKTFSLKEIPACCQKGHGAGNCETQDKTASGSGFDHFRQRQRAEQTGVVA
jgi:hypothetical protein